MTHTRIATAAVLAACALLLPVRQSAAPLQDPQQPPPPSQGTVRITIVGGPGVPPKFAVPDFIPLSNDAETVAAAKMMGQVLWDDLNFEREFYLIPRDTYRSIPQPASLDSVPLDRWKELNADAVAAGSVQRVGNDFIVRLRLIRVSDGQSAISKEYKGGIDKPRLFPHTIADEIHLQQTGLVGVARSKIAFTSDRAG